MEIVYFELNNWFPERDYFFQPQAVQEFPALRHIADRLFPARIVICTGPAQCVDLYCRLRLCSVFFKALLQQFSQQSPEPLPIHLLDLGQKLLLLI